MARDNRGRFSTDLRTADDYRRAVESGDISRDYGLRIARGLDRISDEAEASTQSRAILSGHREDYEDRIGRAGESVDRQLNYFLDQVEEKRGISREDLIDDFQFRDDFYNAFGYDPADGAPDIDFLEAGYHEARGFVYENPKAYAEFLADWLDYDHDEIDYWLGYSKDES